MILNKQTATNLFNQRLNGFPNKHKEIYQTLLYLTSFLPSASTIKHRLWHIINDKQNIPTCQQRDCNEIVKWNRRTYCYNMFCSCSCAGKSEQTKQKRKLTVLDKHQVESISHVISIREKAKRSLKKHYGVSNPSQSSVIQKRKENTSLNNWGTNQPLSSSKIRTRIKQTNLARRDTQNYCYNKLSQSIIEHINDKELLIKYHHHNKLTLEEISKIIGVSASKLGQQFRSLHIDVKYFYRSVTEKEIVSFLTDVLNIPNIVTNARSIIKNMELDIFLPDYNIAIEINGIYWHTESKGKHKTYHIEKTNAANDRNIKLIHIWDIEWIKKKNIIKSMITHMLNQTPNTTYARRCHVAPISSIEKRTFINNNHIAEDSSSTINLGLFNNNQSLLSVMTFSATRFSKYPYNASTEIIRFCSLLNNHIIGGASKLLKYAIERYNLTDIISYSDRRFGTGTVYEVIGFKQEKITPPGYRYSKNGKTYSRIKFQKHKLHKLLEIFDPNLSEYENMIINGFDRIWDCGNYKYQLHIKGLPN